MEIAREIRRSGKGGRVAPLSYVAENLVEKPLLDMGGLEARCYLRFTAADRPGVLGHITGVLGKRGVGIETALQEGEGDGQGSVPIIILTHPAREAAVRNAIDEIDGHDDVTEPTRLIRIEDEL